MKLVVVGVGALGSHIVLLGRNLPVRFTLVDFDRVEQKNLLSQFHTRMGLGKNKAKAVQQTMQGLFAIKVEAVPHKLGPDNVETLLGSADLVVDCLDNSASRTIIQDFVRANDIPCLHGGLAADGQFGRVIWDEHFQIDDEDVEGQATCEGGEHLAFIATVSAAMVSAIQQFLTDGQHRSYHLFPGGLVPLT